MTPYPCVQGNGSIGSNGANAPIVNYNYPYNSLNPIRSYMPVGYITVYPSSASNGGQGGAGANGADGEKGFVVISY